MFFFLISMHRFYINSKPLCFTCKNVSDLMKCWLTCMGSPCTCCQQPPALLICSCSLQSSSSVVVTSWRGWYRTLSSVTRAPRTVLWPTSCDNQLLLIILTAPCVSHFQQLGSIALEPDLCHCHGGQYEGVCQLSQRWWFHNDCLVFTVYYNLILTAAASDLYCLHTWSPLKL